MVKIPSPKPVGFVRRLCPSQCDLPVPTQTAYQTDPRLSEGPRWSRRRCSISVFVRDGRRDDSS